MRSNLKESGCSLQGTLFRRGSIIEALMLVSSTLAPSTFNQGIDLSSSRITGIAHRHVHILVRVVSLWIVAYCNVSLGEMKT